MRTFSIMNFPASPLILKGMAPGKPLLVSGTLSEVTNPYPTFGEQLQRYRKPQPVELKATPVLKVNTKTAVDLFKNKQPAPGTKPAYGMLRPDRF